jgi:hypothetical protein
MEKYKIEIVWSGPYTPEEVIKTMTKGGRKQNGYSGEDYGLYQIYGNHILYGRDKLLYIGQAADQIFSSRFRQHYKDWLKDEGVIKVYLGRIDSKNYDDKDNWYTWRRDISLAEAILVYKYTPCYNSSLKGDYPRLGELGCVRITHLGTKRNLHINDDAPDDYQARVE